MNVPRERWEVRVKQHARLSLHTLRARCNDNDGMFFLQLSGGIHRAWHRNNRGVFGGTIKRHYPRTDFCFVAPKCFFQGITNEIFSREVCAVLRIMKNAQAIVETHQDIVKIKTDYIGHRTSFPQMSVSHKKRGTKERRRPLWKSGYTPAPECWIMNI